MYLLDTNILSNLMKRAPSTILIAKLASIPVEQQFTSSITLGELVYGAWHATGRTAFFLQQLESLVTAHLPILPFDTLAANHYGEIRAQLEAQGTPLGDADLRIAAIALARGLTVVTGNVRHFHRIPGLSIENWLEPS
jgi:predicted nucleic acid-binding protein